MVKALSGQALNLRKNKQKRSFDNEFMAQLLGNRQKICDKVTEKVLRDSDEKKPKIVRASSKHLAHAPATLMMTIPIVKTEHATSEEREVGILYGGIGTLWMVLSTENVKHLQAGLTGSPKAAKKPRKEKA